jgi:hypothetical protein
VAVQRDQQCKNLIGFQHQGHGHAFSQQLLFLSVVHRVRLKTAHQFQTYAYVEWFLVHTELCGQLCGLVRQLVGQDRKTQGNRSIIGPLKGRAVL